MQRATEIEELDRLLYDWHDWCVVDKPDLGAKPATYCAQSVSSRQWEDSTEASCGRLHVFCMERVQWCVYKLPSGLQRAVGIEMRNRDAKAAVWRNPTGETYAAACEALLPIARSAGLFA